MTREELSAGAALQWLHAMGADEIVQEQALDRFADSAAVSAKPSRPTVVTPVVEPRLVAPVAAPTAQGPVPSSLAEIVQALTFMDAHPLRRTASHLCFYEGPNAPPVLILADRPRSEEDRSGQVFAGKARLLLANMLSAIGLKLEDVGLMNFVPWRPPGNRAVAEAEALALVPYAQRAIGLLSPRAILGFTALPGQYLAGGDASFPRQRGKLLAIAGVPYLCTFHPDELLKNQTHKRLAWRDLQAFKEKLDG